MLLLPLRSQKGKHLERQGPYSCLSSPSTAEAVVEAAAAEVAGASSLASTLTSLSWSGCALASLPSSAFVAGWSSLSHSARSAAPTPGKVSYCQANRSKGYSPGSTSVPSRETLTSRSPFQGLRR